MAKLFIVPTPIGNLKDITLRALDVLKSVDFILAEDTRQSLKLLSHYNIQNKLKAYHQHNEHKQLNNIVEQIKAANSVALVSDAGTPAISDPGFLLVRECLKNDIEIECLPGPTAFVPALVNSGFPLSQFTFAGFLPHKKGRLKMLEQFVGYEHPVVFYESPHRILKFLEQVTEVFGNNCELSISRELTKIHEETLNGSPAELVEHFNQHPPKGEFVIVIHPKVPQNAL